MTKVLYFDTCAVVKCYHKEKGTELIRWIVKKAENRFLYSLAIRTSEVTLFEFPNALENIVRRGDLSPKGAASILKRATNEISEIFRIKRNPTIPGFKHGEDTSYKKLCKKHGLSPNKMGRDAEHLAYIINFLRYLGDPSKPRVLTSDRKFKKLIKDEGYEVIDPEKVTINDFKSIITS